MSKIKRDFSILMRGYKLIFSIDAAFIPLNMISAVLESLYPFIIIYMGAEILNALARGGDVKDIFLLMAIMIILNFVTQQVKQAIARMLTTKDKVFDQKFTMFLNSKTLEMEYGKVEDPKTHKKRQKINDIKNINSFGIWKLITESKNVMSGSITMITSVAITFRAFTIYDATAQGGLAGILTSPFSSLLLLAFMVISTLLSIRVNATSVKKTHKKMDEMIVPNRISWFVHAKYITDYQVGKDIRLYNQKGMILDYVNRMFSEGVLPILAQIESMKNRYSNINTALSSLISLLVYVFVGVKALYGLIGLGDLFKYINGIAKFNDGLVTLLNSFHMLRANTEYLEVIYEYLDMPNASHQGTLTTEKRADNEYELEFHNVSFKYPGTKEYVIKNLNLKFNIGRRMAVVGMNGSGKTTMIKLLCRLYDPNEGEITLNGIDIRKYEYTEYLGIFSVVFQDFRLFPFPLGQNVASSIRYDGVLAEKCLHMAGFGDRLGDMPKGLDTSLYKNFDEEGVEISGGEAQKIALARALYKDAPFIILDEPTAALDPVAEFEIYSKFNEIVGDKTAVYISHRLSSCRFCDDIAVFHQGELVQRGNHDTLLADSDGKYYELWSAQAQYYQGKAVS